MLKSNHILSHVLQKICLKKSTKNVFAGDKNWQGIVVKETDTL